MNNEKKDQQIANNHKILDSIRNEGGNRGHIFSRAWKRMRAMQIIRTQIKRQKEDEQKALTNAENYLDDWAFHHGEYQKYPQFILVDGKKTPHPKAGEFVLDDKGEKIFLGITKDNFKEAVADCVDRASSLHQVKQQTKEEAEYRAMCGALGEGFDDEPMGDLPGDGEFRQSVQKFNKDHGL